MSAGFWARTAICRLDVLPACLADADVVLAEAGGQGVGLVIQA